MFALISHQAATADSLHIRCLLSTKAVMFWGGMNGASVCPAEDTFSHGGEVFTL